MSAKERWEAKNNNKTRGNTQSKIQQVSYNKEFFDDLKSSIISAVTQNTDDQATDNFNAGNALEDTMKQSVVKLDLTVADIRIFQYHPSLHSLHITTKFLLLH